jgi:hypothetical protein
VTERGCSPTRDSHCRNPQGQRNRTAPPSQAKVLSLRRPQRSRFFPPKITAVDSTRYRKLSNHSNQQEGLRHEEPDFVAVLCHCVSPSFVGRWPWMLCSWCLAMMACEVALWCLLGSVDRVVPCTKSANPPEGPSRLLARLSGARGAEGPVPFLLWFSVLCSSPCLLPEHPDGTTRMRYVGSSRTKPAHLRFCFFLA